VHDSAEPGSILASFNFGRSPKPSHPSAPLNLNLNPTTALLPVGPAPIPTPTLSPYGADQDDGPAVLVHPASPAFSSGSFETAKEEPSPAPVASTSFLPPSPVSGGLAARRLLNKKRLSLVVPAGPAAHGPASPISPSLLAADDALAETRSLPPTPVSLAAYIGAEGSEQQDRTIGRLMLKQQADEMREQMKGGRGMKRRTSIPRLNLAPSGKLPNGKPAPLNLAGTSSNAGMAVQLLRRDSVERGGTGGRDMGGSALEDDNEGDDPPEEFPYALGPREIVPGIYLGSELNARDPGLLNKWGIGAVLNVAKEVECPWVDEGVDEESDADLPPPTPSYYERRRSSTGGQGWEEVETPSPPIRDSSPPPPTPQTKQSHRRTSTQTGIPAPEGGPNRPQFVRPTASTPNLQSAYAAGKTVVVPPLPHGTTLSPIQASPSPSKTDMPIPSPDTTPVSYLPSSPPILRSLSSSPPQPRRSPPRERRTAGSSTGPRTASGVRFTSNKRTGRPELNYLWLKWGHDESDLVEAGKFQIAFDFLDAARATGQKTLVHCQCGVSRSATVVIAYCMREAARALETGQSAGELEGVKGMHDTYSFVKEKSEWVGPNLGLVFQLVAYERNLRGASGPDPYGEEDEEGPYPADPTSPPQAPVPARIAFSSAEPAPSPRTPLWSEGSTASGSQLSTPDMHEPALSPTVSLVSSVNSTGGRSARTNAIGRDEVVILEADMAHEPISIAGMAERLSLENLITHTAAGSNPSSVKSSPIEPSPTTGPGSPFVLPLPPRAPPRRYSQDDAISPTVSSFRPPPPMLVTRLPQSLGSSQITPRATYPTVPKPSLSMNTNLGPASRSGLTAGPLSASTSSSSTVNGARGFSSPVTDLDADGESRGSRAAFGSQQTPQERRASHRRVFSETITVSSLVKARQAAHTPAASPTAH